MFAKDSFPRLCSGHMIIIVRLIARLCTVG